VLVSTSIELDARFGRHFDSGGCDSPPGKGTQCEKLVKDYGFVHLSGKARRKRIMTK
jgi:hypothetical protein